MAYDAWRDGVSWSVGLSWPLRSTHSFVNMDERDEPYQLNSRRGENLGYWWWDWPRSCSPPEQKFSILMKDVFIGFTSSVETSVGRFADTFDTEKVFSCFGGAVVLSCLKLTTIVSKHPYLGLWMSLQTNHQWGVQHSQWWRCEGCSKGFDIHYWSYWC